MTLVRNTLSNATAVRLKNKNIIALVLYRVFWHAPFAAEAKETLRESGVMHNCRKIKFLYSQSGHTIIYSMP